MSAAATPSARERPLAAAHELFYAEGVQTVGIDRVIERAGVAKASLYNVFGSKEELIRAYLEERHAGTVRALLEAVARHSDPRARLLAVFDAQAELFVQPGFRGCAFTSACAEAPAGGLIQAAATSYRKRSENCWSRSPRRRGRPRPGCTGRPAADRLRRRRPVGAHGPRPGDRDCRPDGGREPAGRAAGVGRLARLVCRLRVPCPRWRRCTD